MKDKTKSDHLAKSENRPTALFSHSKNTPNMCVSIPTGPINFKCDARNKETSNAIHYIWNVMGPENFERFVSKWGGRQIWIPKPGVKMPCGLCSKKNKDVRKFHDSGWDISTIARYTGLSKKSIYRICCKKK